MQKTEIEKICLPEKSFSIEMMRDLEKNGQLKDYKDAKDYIFSYFYESAKQTYYFYNYDLDDFELYSCEDFKKSVLDKLDEKKLVVSIKKNDKIFSIVTELGKPRLYKQSNKYYINVAGTFLHQTYKKYDEYTSEIKNKVQMVLDMMKELACNGDEDMFKAYIKYYAQIARGIKTEAVIYRKTPEGVGKSTETTMMIDYVFGKKVCLLSNTSDPLTSRFNKILLGKLLVVFEEMPTFSDSEWNGVCGKLKSLCTEKRSTYEDKNEKRFEADNISNFQINTNQNALKESNGRRIIVLDFSLKRKGDWKFFKNFKDECYNMDVGEAVFSYLLTKITDEEANNFYAQRDFPETKNKRVAISNSLQSPYKFLKDVYVLPKKSIGKINRKALYDLYVSYCVKKTLKAVKNIEFYSRLEEIGISSKKTEGEHKYNISFDVLNTISNKEKWICEYDDDIIKTDNNDDNSMLAEQLEIKEEQNTKLQEENNELKKQLEELKKLLNTKENTQTKTEQKTPMKNQIQSKQLTNKIKVVVSDTESDSDDDDDISAIF